MMRFSYQFTFALINFIDATVHLASLGFYAPGWPLHFAAWYALRHINRRKKVS